MDGEWTESVMPDSQDPRRLVSNCFDKMHKLLSDIKEHVAVIDDSAANELVRVLEYSTLISIRRLRCHMGIPYDWHEDRGGDVP